MRCTKLWKVTDLGEFCDGGEMWENWRGGFQLRENLLYSGWEVMKPELGGGEGPAWEKS